MDAMAMMAALVVMGQTGAEPPRPSRDPALTSPAVDERLLEQQKKRLNTEPVLPVTPAASQAAIPGVPPPVGVDLSGAGHRVFPEGSFVAPRVGSLVRAASGDFVFVAARLEGKGPTDPPMVLLPCETLTQIAGAPGDGLVSIGGQVFVYRGRHYMLPTAFSREVAPTEPTEATEAPGAPPAADPSVQDLMRALEEGAGRAVPPPAPGEGPESARAEQGMRKDVMHGEGSLLVSRRARLVRLPGASGQFGATFDNDTNSPGDAPMVLLPCRALERLEAVAAWRGENTPFLLSGRVYTFEGRNFVLPVLVQAQRESDVTPMQ